MRYADDGHRRAALARCEPRSLVPRRDPPKRIAPRPTMTSAENIAEGGHVTPRRAVPKLRIQTRTTDVAHEDVDPIRTPRNRRGACRVRCVSKQPVSRPRRAVPILGVKSGVVASYEDVDAVRSPGDGGGI